MNSGLYEKLRLAVHQLKAMKLKNIVVDIEYIRMSDNAMRGRLLINVEKRASYKMPDGIAIYKMMKSIGFTVDCIDTGKFDAIITLRFRINRVFSCGTASEDSQ